MKPLYVAVAASMAIVLAGCSSGQAESDTASASADSSVSALSAAASASSADSATASATPSASAEALAPLDRLLPTEVIEGYAPSYPVDNQFDEAKDVSEFAPLEKVRPKDCVALLQFMTTPLEDEAGQLAGFASTYVNSAYPGPTFTESLFVYPSEAEAAAAYQEAVALAPECRNASGEWPQQGTIIIDDGMNREKLSVGSIKTLSDTAVILPSKPGYDGEIGELNGLALAGDAVLWLETRTYEENSNAKRLARFTTFMNHAQEYALTGALPEAASADAAAQLTLDCLQLEPVPYQLWKNYDEYAGKGRGRDLFVESRVAATNNCGKTIRGFKYDAEFTDELDDTLLSGNASEKLIIKPGETKKTQANRGWTVRAAFDADKIKTFLKADPADITVSLTPTKVLFADKTSLP